jgi:hypothetical protein
MLQSKRHYRAGRGEFQKALPSHGPFAVVKHLVQGFNRSSGPEIKTLCSGVKFGVVRTPQQ